MSTWTTVVPTRNFLERSGYRYDTVERYFAGRRHDFMGFGDVIAYPKTPRFKMPMRELMGLITLSGVLCIQSCKLEHVQGHLEKICLGQPRPAVRDFLFWDNRLEVWGWRYLKISKKDGSKGTRSVWKPKFFRVLYEDGDFYTMEGSEVEIVSKALTA